MTPRDQWTGKLKMAWFCSISGHFLSHIHFTGLLLLFVGSAFLGRVWVLICLAFSKSKERHGKAFLKLLMEYDYKLLCWSCHLLRDFLSYLFCHSGRLEELQEFLCSQWEYIKKLIVEGIECSSKKESCKLTLFFLSFAFSDVFSSVFCQCVPLLPPLSSLSHNLLLPEELCIFFFRIFIIISLSHSCLFAYILFLLWRPFNSFSYQN